MGPLPAALGLVCGVGALVCWILVLVKIFRDSVGLGVLGIISIGIFTFIYGWMKCEEYHIRKVMTWWTVFLAGGNVLGIWFLAALASAKAAAGP